MVLAPFSGGDEGAEKFVIQLDTKIPRNATTHCNQAAVKFALEQVSHRPCRRELTQQ
jgi:hypothetical protein